MGAEGIKVGSIELIKSTLRFVCLFLLFNVVLGWPNIPPLSLYIYILDWLVSYLFI